MVVGTRVWSNPNRAGRRYGVVMKSLEVDGVGRVSRIGLGTWQFGSREWGYGDRLRRRVRRVTSSARSLALGVTLFDTAEVYGFGKSERILGEALGDRARRGRQSRARSFPSLRSRRWSSSVRTRSARRLQLDRIPLYQIHQPNPCGARFGDHARDARPARQRRHRRGRRLQLLARRDGGRPTRRSDARSSAIRCISLSRTRRHWSLCRSQSARTAS